MTEHLNRRDFLKLAAFTTTGLVLAACGKEVHSSTPLPSAIMPPSPTPRPGLTRLQKDIAEWQSAPGMIHTGGLEFEHFRPDSRIDPRGVNAVTVLDSHPLRRLRQGGPVQAVRLLVEGSSEGGQIRLRIFRQSADHYELAAESELLSLPHGNASPHEIQFSCDPPLACETGDLLGYTTYSKRNHLPAVAWRAEPQGDARFTFSENGESLRFENSLPFAPCIEALGPRPYLVIAGDSIAAGYPENVGMYDVGPHDRQHDPACILETLLPGLRTQNFGSGGKSWDWVLSDSLAPALAAQPRVLIVHAGVNNAMLGLTWEHEKLSFDRVKAACDEKGVTLVVDEIAPMPNKSDASAEAIRTFNTGYAQWCQENGVRLVRLHDEMGQVRPSTGQMDDLKPEYLSVDGVHLSLQGKQRLAALWLEALSAD